jgi:hypothetical protein
MFKKTAIIAGIGLAISATAQADYNWQVDAGYARSSTDTELKTNSGKTKNSNDADLYNIGGTWYMETVDTSKGPLGEAAFLDHASDITVAYTRTDLDLGDLDNDEGNNYSISSRYVAEGPGWKLSGWLVDLGYDRREPGDEEIDYYNIGIGKYVTPNTTVVVDYQRIDVNNGNDTNAYSLDVEHFFAFSSGGLKVAADGGKTVVSGADDVESWGLGGTWYLNNNLGFGAGYARESQNGYEVDTWVVNAEWFITENFAVDLAYAQTDPDTIDLGNNDRLETELDTISLNALFRF